VYNVGRSHLPPITEIMKNQVTHPSLVQRQRETRVRELPASCHANPRHGGMYHRDCG